MHVGKSTGVFLYDGIRKIRPTLGEQFPGGRIGPWVGSSMLRGWPGHIVSELNTLCFRFPG